MAKIAIIEDNETFWKTLKEILKNSGHSVLRQFNNGKEFLTYLENNMDSTPDVAFMDVRMPIMNGFETAILLRKSHPKIKIIALTIFEDEQTILKMLHAGARAYICKFNLENNLKFETITMVLQNGYFINPNLLQKTAPRKLKFKITKTNFTIRQIEFINFCASDFSFKEIAEKMRISYRTIEDYKKTCCKKLNVLSRIGIVQKAKFLGLII